MRTPLTLWKCIMVGLRPDCITLMAAALSSRKMQRIPLFQRRSTVSHLSNHGLDLVRTAVTTATRFAANVDDPIESSRLDNVCI